MKHAVPRSGTLRQGWAGTLAVRAGQAASWLLVVAVMHGLASGGGGLYLHLMG